MAFWKSTDAYGSSVAANPRTLSLSKYHSGLGHTIQRDDVLAQRHVFASPSSGNLYIPAPIFPTSRCGFHSKRREKFLHTFLWDLSINDGRIANTRNSDSRLHREIQDESEPVPKKRCLWNKLVSCPDYFSLSWKIVW